MPHEDTRPSPATHRGLAQDETHAWWLSVLEGKDTSGHPVFGKAIQTRVESGTLRVTGHVPTEAARHQVEGEIERLHAQGITDIQTELDVGKETDEEAGLLVQTLVVVFENADQATLAAARLRDSALLHVPSVQLLGTAVAGFSAGAEAEAQPAPSGPMPDGMDEEVRQEIEAGHAVLVATVDETDAFKARQLLEEDTRSLKTLILPPQATEPADARRAQP